MSYFEAVTILETIRSALYKIPAKGGKNREGKERTNEAFLLAIKILKEKEEEKNVV